MKIRNIILAVCALFVFPQFSSAQFSFGIKTGVNQSNLEAPQLFNDIEQIPDFRNITNMTVGLVGELSINDRFAVQSELNYARKGFRIKESMGLNLGNIPLPIGVEARTTFQYLEVPILAKASLGTGNVRGYAMLGAAAGYALNGQVDTRANALLDIDIATTPINLDAIDYQRFEVSGIGGLGVEFLTPGNGKLFLDARYQHGITQAYDIPIVRDRVAHRNFGVNVGYLMPF